jgi:hypothetical protein
MGAYAPAPLLDQDALQEIETLVLQPTLKALKDRGIDYRGVIYAGLMLTATGPQVIDDLQPQGVDQRVADFSVELVDLFVSHHFLSMRLSE